MKCLLPYCNDVCENDSNSEFCRRHLRKQKECWLPYCNKPRLKDTYGDLYHYCSRGHSIKCWLPECNITRAENMNGGFHICCSRSHYEKAQCRIDGCKNYRAMNEQGNKRFLAYNCSQHLDWDYSNRSGPYQHGQPIHPQSFSKSGESHNYNSRINLKVGNSTG